MNVAGRNERDDGADGIDGVIGDDEVTIRFVVYETVGGLIFLAAMDADDAPRNVIVNGGFLSGQPDERDDGETPVGFDMEEVATVFALVGRHLFRGEKVRRFEIGQE